MLIKFYIVILLLFNIVFANTDSSSVYLEKGNFSIQFQITENFKISNFQGSIISTKYLFTNRSAIRIGLSANYSNSEDRHHLRLYEKEIFSIEINSQYLYHITDKQLSLYTAVGPTFRWDYSSTVNSQKQITQKEFHDYENIQTHGYGVGVNAIIGGEYFVADYLSFIAEYGVLFEYFYSKLHHKIHGSSELKEYRFDPLYVKFGFSLNF